MFVLCSRPVNTFSHPRQFDSTPPRPATAATFVAKDNTPLALGTGVAAVPVAVRYTHGALIFFAPKTSPPLP